MPPENKTSAALGHQLIDRAAQSKNPMEALPQFFKYDKDDFEVSLYCKTSKNMDPKTIKWAFKLAEKNVGPFYKACSLGWQPKIKQAELNKNWARYFVAVDKQKNPVGFAMFRFDHEFENRVLYCYELQIDTSSQRKGLGTFMMKALEECAKYWQMEYIYLTVLKNNPEGVKFYKNIGFNISENSPDKSEDAPYEILSKSLI